MNSRSKSPRNISELAFNIIYESEQIEGYSIDQNIDKLNGINASYIRLDKDTVLDFLFSSNTRVKVVLKRDAEPVLVAQNITSGETMEITGLGDHFLALVKIVTKAKDKIEELKENPNAKLIDHQFIKAINARLLSTRVDEVAIGSYREFDFFGRPMEVHVSITNKEGRNVPSKCINVETSVDKNVEKQMTELINWVNTTAFKGDRDIMKDIAYFHTRFIEIHPFRDGNGRTVRLLTNYFLLLNNLPLVSIPASDREEYIACIDYSLAPDEQIYKDECPMFEKYYDYIYQKQGSRTEDNKYNPLIDLLNKNLSNTSRRKAIMSILDYESTKKFYVTPEEKSNNEPNNE